jgi:hypothetical protein
MVCVIPQNLQMNVLMLANKNPNIQKKVFNMFKEDPKIKATCAQIEILNEFYSKSVWGKGESQPLRIKLPIF